MPVYRDKDIPVEERFWRLLEVANRDTGRRAVILVDEYNKPLLEGGGSFDQSRAPFVSDRVSDDFGL